MAGEGLDDLLACRPGAALQERFARQHETRGAEAALRRVVLVERSLNWRELAVLREAFERGHSRAVDSSDRQEARAARLALDEDGAGAAAALLAAGFGAREADLLP